MEVQQWPLPKQEILAQPNGAILSVKLFDQGQLMAIFDATGEAHIYSRSRDKLIHRSCCKLFESPIVASDIALHLGTWQFLVIDLSGTFKLCKLTPELQLIATRQSKIQLSSPILTCLFYANNEKILATTEAGLLVFIDLVSDEKEVVEISQSSGAVLARLGSQNKIYLSSGKEILVYRNDNHSKYTIVKLDLDIVDFAVSAQYLYSTLVVLTQKQLQFYIITQKRAVKTTTIDLYSKYFCAKLGWGKDGREIGLYQCINGFIRTRCFYKANTGKWFEEAGKAEQPQKMIS